MIWDYEGVQQLQMNTCNGYGIMKDLVDYKEIWYVVHCME